MISYWVASLRVPVGKTGGQQACKALSHAYRGGLTQPQIEKNIGEFSLYGQSQEPKCDAWGSLMYYVINVLSADQLIN